MLARDGRRPHHARRRQRLSARRWQNSTPTSCARSASATSRRPASSARPTRRSSSTRCRTTSRTSGLIHLILPNAKIIDARRHPLGCCFSGFKQHFARGQTLHLRPRRDRPLLPRLRRADGALRRGAAGPRAPRVLRAHGRGHRGRGAPAARLLRPAVRGARACASTRTSAPCAPPAPSRCASRSIARASITGGTSSPGSARSKRRSGSVLERYPERTGVLIPWRRHTLGCTTYTVHNEIGEIDDDTQQTAQAPSGIRNAVAAQFCRRAARWRACSPALPSRRRNRRRTSGGLEEVVVTAQKRQRTCRTCRSASRRSAPSGSRSCSVNDFDDYVKFLPSVSYQTARPRLRARLTCAAWRAARTATTPARCRASACISTSSRSRRSRARSTCTSTTSRASKRWRARRARCTARARRRARSASSPTSPIQSGFDGRLRPRRQHDRRRRHRLPRRRLRQHAARREARRCAWSAGRATTRGYIDNVRRDAHVPDVGHRRRQRDSRRRQLQRRRHLRRARRAQDRPERHLDASRPR